MRTTGPIVVLPWAPKLPVRFRSSFVAMSLESPSGQVTPHTTSPKVTEKKSKPLLRLTKSESFSNNLFVYFQFDGQIKFLPHKWSITYLKGVKYHKENDQYEHFNERATDKGNVAKGVEFII